MLIFEMLCGSFKQKEIEKAKQQLDGKVMLSMSIKEDSLICEMHR